MKTVTSAWSVALRDALMQPSHGVVGLVDDMLALCREHDLELDWCAGCLRVRSAGGDWHELSDAPLRLSVFRAILARLARLCNQRNAGSASPYGGQGEISVGADMATVFRIVFTNTPDEQRFELMRGAR